jgi:hypothetical protein
MSILRRNFVKGFGLAGIALAGVAGYKEVKERIVYKQDELPTAELEKQLDGKPVLQLQATYGEELPPAPFSCSNGFIITGFTPRYKEGTEINVKVNIVPGPDGKLYVKENDTWRKI